MNLTKEDIVAARCDVDTHASELAKEFQPIFQKCGWTWSGGLKSMCTGVPTEEDIDITLRVLASNLYPGKERSNVSTGRLEIVVKKSETGWVTTEVRVVTRKTISVRHEEEEKRRRGQ
jgi:hypothetical protein